MAASPKFPSVWIPALAPEKERAGQPRLSSIMAIRAAERCSPVASKASSSRRGGWGRIRLASDSSSSVLFPAAETTSTT